MSIGRVAIVGLGAVGGSLAIDLRRAGVQVTGYDIDPEHVMQARRAGFDAGVWHEQGVESDVVIIAVPVRRSRAVLEVLARRTSYRLVTDVSSTQRAVIDAAQRVGLGACFVAAHPFAGTHESGWPAARADMFGGRTVFVSATPLTRADALLAAEDLWQLVGAIPQQGSAEEHDARVAWSSHLPQLTATALALVLKSAGVERAQLGSGGTDMTRLSGSDPDLWLDIAVSNADMLDEPLGCLIEALTEIRGELRTGHEARLLTLLRGSRLWYEAAAVPAGRAV